MSITCRLYIHRTVDVHFTIFSSSGTLLQGDIIKGMRELLIDFLRTMHQCNTRFVDSHASAYLQVVTHHGVEMCQSRTRDNGRIREKEQFIIGRDFRHRNMAQHIPFRKQTMFLVQYGTKQIVGIDNPFHQYIGMAFTNEQHPFLSCHIGATGFEHLHMVGILMTDIFGIEQMGSIGHQQEIGKALTQATEDNILRMRVVRTNHHNTLALLHGTQTTN